MGGGVCRPSDAFASVQSLSAAASLPVTRAFMQAILAPANTQEFEIDPYLPQHVSAFLSSALPSALSAPASASSHRRLASRLFHHYCHPQTVTLSYQQLSSLLHDHLCASLLALPALLSNVHASAARLTRSILRPRSRDEQRSIDSAYAAVLKDSETAMRSWYQSLLRREDELTREVWKRLLAGAEGSKGAAGLTEAAFVSGWQTACDAAMAAKEFRPPRGVGGGENDEGDDEEEEGEEAAEDVWAPLQRLSVAETKVDDLSQGDDTTIVEAMPGDSPRRASTTSAATQSSAGEQQAK